VLQWTVVDFCQVICTEHLLYHFPIFGSLTTGCCDKMFALGVKYFIEFGLVQISSCSCFYFQSLFDLTWPDLTTVIWNFCCWTDLIVTTYYKDKELYKAFVRPVNNMCLSYGSVIMTSFHYLKDMMAKRMGSLTSDY